MYSSVSSSVGIKWVDVSLGAFEVTVKDDNRMQLSQRLGEFAIFFGISLAFLALSGRFRGTVVADSMLALGERAPSSVSVFACVPKSFLGGSATSRRYRRSSAVGLRGAVTRC
jgi:hypothetical protein